MTDPAAPAAPDPTPAAPTPAAPYGGMTAAQAEASLAALRADPKWVSALFDGSVAARQDFDRLTQTIAGVSTLDKAHSDPVHDQLVEVTANGELSKRDLRSAVAGLAQSGFDHVAIDQILTGEKQSTETVAYAERRLQEMQTDKEFAAKLLGGDAKARREWSYACAVVAVGAKE